MLPMRLAMTTMNLRMFGFPMYGSIFREWDFDEIAIPVEDSFILMDTYLLTTLKRI